MRLLVLGVLAVVGCGSSLRETCDLAARPGTWRITATLRPGIEGIPYGFPGDCPTIALTVHLPVSAGDTRGGVRFTPRSTELGSRDECFGSYTEGSPSAAGRTACGGQFDTSSATTMRLAECFFQVGPPDQYGDFSSFCAYTAQWERVAVDP